jgi:hypothetical protein
LVLMFRWQVTQRQARNNTLPGPVERGTADTDAAGNVQVMLTDHPTCMQ